jgi:signal transduction histidine kinase
MTNDERINILLVDDQPAKLTTYLAILEDLGETLVTAGSGREALEHLLKKEIAVILIDVIMPDLDGFELAKMIREHPRFQTTAIIFVSAIALTDLDRLKGYEYGAVDYVPVPVVPELLRAKVRVFAELYRKTRQLEMLNAELERRVEERTAELARANADLEQRVERRTQEREAALAQVHEMQKLESLGQLTGGLAHDFNNLLMTILGNLDLLAKKVADDPRARGLVDGAILSAERGAALTARMLAFARRQELKPEVVNAAGLIDGMAEMLGRTLGPSVRMCMEFQDDLVPILADRNQLELALLNLALNARDAMSQGGRLTIGVRSETIRPGSASTHAQDLEPGAYVCIAVEDTGIGMDEATLKRATEPFFTTKGPGKGTGLGLSMVHGLAAQSGGRMRMFSQPNAGTTVELWFPAAEQSEAEMPSIEGSLSTLQAAQQRRVLLVDDDPAVADSMAAMLDDLGHPVLVASSGPAALELIRSEADVDLVITDYAMADMTGVEFARLARQLRPDLPIILTTGYADVANGEDLGLPRLKKPYRQSDLAAMLTRIDNSRPPPKIATVFAESRSGNLR